MDRSAGLPYLRLEPGVTYSIHEVRTCCQGWIGVNLTGQMWESHWATIVRAAGLPYFPAKVRSLHQLARKSTVDWL